MNIFFFPLRQFSLLLSYKSFITKITYKLFVCVVRFYDRFSSYQINIDNDTPQDLLMCLLPLCHNFVSLNFIFNTNVLFIFTNQNSSFLIFRILEILNILGEIGSHQYALWSTNEENYCYKTRSQIVSLPYLSSSLLST